MPQITDQNYLLQQQYKDASNLNARVRLHAQFSTNPYSWFLWLFDQFEISAQARVLELGCGPADLWRRNAQRIPPGWEITLSDFSAGMVEQARANLADTRPFAFREIDAQSIPFEDGTFDVVIANHMLYHVPDRPQALREIRRVLKPGGKFYTTTVGENHLRELLAIPYRFDPEHAVDALRLTNEFSLENGAAQLQPFFERVEMRRYPDSLHVTEAGPLADFLLSSFRFEFEQDRRAELVAFIEGELRQNGGALDITKDSGLFLCA